MNQKNFYFDLLIEYIKLNTLHDEIFNKFSDKNLRKLSVKELESIAIGLNKNFSHHITLTAKDAIERVMRNPNTNYVYNVPEIEMFLNLLRIKYKIQ